MKKTKTKNKIIKNKSKVVLVAVKVGRGRPKAIIEFPKKGVFTVKQLNSKFPQYTKVTIGKLVKQAKENGVITLIDKKISAGNGKGQPERFYQFGKIKNVKISFVPKKPKKIYKPKIKTISKETINLEKIIVNPPATDFLGNELAPADIPELVEV